MKYKFLHEASTKLVLVHLREVEDFTKKILENFYPSTTQIKVVDTPKLVSEKTTFERLCFKVMLQAPLEDKKEYLITIPIDAINKMDENCTDIVMI